MKTQYRVKMLSDFTEPHWASKCSNVTVDHLNIDEYSTCDKKAFYDMLDEFIDAPAKKLNEEDIRKDFSSSENSTLTSKAVGAIKAYYNGRLKLKNRVHGDLKRHMASRMSKDTPLVLKYKIPFGLNNFSCIDDETYGAPVKQNEAYIEIEISKVD